MSYKKELFVNKLIKTLQDTNADYKQIIKARNETMTYGALNINEVSNQSPIYRLLDIKSDPMDYSLMQHFEDTFNIKERVTLSKADEIKFDTLVEMPEEVIYFSRR